MPPLDEETALFMPITDPRISLTEATEILRQQDAIIAADPAVAMVVGKVGRAETSTDPAPVNMSETTITFKPKEQWPKGLTKDAILARLDDKLQIPGVTNIWTQPIRNRIDMLSTGIRTQIGIKVFGPDLRVIEQNSEQIKEVVSQVPGATDLYAERTTGSPYLEMTVDRRSRGSLRFECRRRGGCDRNRCGRQESDHHHRGTAALPGACPLRARFPREPATARRRACNRQQRSTGAAEQSRQHQNNTWDRR